MDLKQLLYFTHVAELGSYTRAAELIDVAQPVLSRQIRKLEIELRQNLLIRHGRGVILTDAGRVLLKHSRLILQQLEQEMLKLNLKPQIELEVNSVGVINQILAEGIGAAIFSKAVLKFIPQQQLRAIPIVEPELVNRIYLAYSSKRLPSKLQRKTADMIKSITAELY